MTVDGEEHLLSECSKHLAQRSFAAASLAHQQHRLLIQDALMHKDSDSLQLLTLYQPTYLKAPRDLTELSLQMPLEILLVVPPLLYLHLGDFFDGLFDK